MNLLRLTFAAAALTLLSACAYNAAPVAAPAINIVSNFENKVPGKFALILADDIGQTRKEVRPSSHACSAHTYPLIAGQAIESSIRRTMDSVFESVSEVATPMTPAAMKAGGYSGQISVRLSEFSPRLSCQIGFWSGSCVSNVDIGFGIEIKNTEGKTVHSSSVGGSKSAEGDAGGACGGGANILADATSRSVKDALERAAERISNVTALRQK